MSDKVIELDVKTDLEFSEAAARVERDNPSLGVVVYETSDGLIEMEAFGKMVRKDLLWLLESMKQELVSGREVPG